MLSFELILIVSWMQVSRLNKNKAILLVCDVQ
jgi:hypothetical protein